MKIYDSKKEESNSILFNTYNAVLPENSIFES